MVTTKRYILIAVIVLISGAIYFINSTGVKRTGSNDAVSVTPRMSIDTNGTENAIPSKYLSAKVKSERYALAKEITTPDGFINTEDKPITLGSLVGKKVILLDFWTYSCINCQRTTPYLNAWYEKYKDKGFVIVGIHTPEFEFEKEYDNVKMAVEKLGIKFPVVLDNDYSTWTAYKNRYWPRKYLIDIDGYVVFDHIGEGGYEETEQKIQDALSERMAVLGESGTIEGSLTKEVLVQNNARSPETYFGAERNTFFGNGSAGVSGNQNDLTLPEKLERNTLYLSGDWNITEEFAENNSIDAKIVYSYIGKDVFLVAKADTESSIEVLRDGKPLGAEAGADIIKTPDGKTVVKIQEARLYKIIEGDQSESGILEFRTHKSRLKAFAFTFG